MTAPLAPAAPAPTPTATNPPATDAPGGGERFASALDDAVTSGQGGPRGQERAAEGEDTPTEPTAEVPAGEQTAAGPGVSPAGMPPALWALLTGIGPGAAAPAAPGGAVPVAPDAASPVVPAGDTAPAGGAVAAVAGTGGPVAVTAAADVLPPSAVPGAAATAVPLPARVDAALPGPPAAAPTTPVTPAVPGAPAADPLPGFTVVVAAPMTPAPTTAPAAGEPPATAAPTALPAVTATAPGEGTAPDTGSAPDQDTPPPAPAAPATTAAAGPAVPSASPVAVAGPAAPAAPAAPAPPVSGQVAQQVAVLRTAPDGTHTMTLVLTPETLGPVEVQVTLSQGTVDLSLRSATEAGRAALLEALPDLRRDLAGAGLTCTNASVDRDTGGSWASAQQHASGDRAGQHGQPDGRGRPWLRGTDVDAGRSAPVPTAVPSSGLDVRV